MAKDAHVFPISDIQKKRNWGGSRGRWGPALIPEIKIPFYVDKPQAVSIKIYKEGLLVNAINTNVDKGFNEFVFDATFSKKGRQAFLTKQKETSLKAAKNGMFYLPKGKYAVKIGPATRSFTIR